jgi:hypothetical protein
MAAEASDDRLVTMDKPNDGRIKERGRDRVQPVRTRGASHSAVSVLWPKAVALSENRALREIHDPNALAECFPGLARISQMGSGTFLSQVESVDFDSAAVHRNWIGQRVHLKARALPDALLVAYVAAASDAVVCEGLAWTQGDLLVLGANEVDLCTFGLARSSCSRAPRSQSP